MVWVDWLLRVRLWALVKLLLMVKFGGRGYELALSLYILWLVELLSRLGELLLLVLLKLWTSNLFESKFAPPGLEELGGTVAGAEIGRPSCLVVARHFLLNDPEVVYLCLVLKQFSDLVDLLHNLVIQAARRTTSSWAKWELGT